VIEPTGKVIDVIDTGKTGARMIHGCASSPAMTSHKQSQSLSSEGCRFKLPVPLLAGHGRVEGHSASLEQAKIGDVVWITKTPTGIFIRAVLAEGMAADHAWKLIVAGEYRALSVSSLPGSATLKGVVDGIRFYDEWTLREVSICRKGANPDAEFEIFKPPIYLHPAKQKPVRDAKRSARDSKPVVYLSAPKQKRVRDSKPVVYLKNQKGRST
jgi:hypothetical protein